MQAHFAILPGLTSFEALRRLVRQMGYGDYMKEQHGDVSRLNVLLALANQSPAPEAFLARLRELKACIEAQEYRPDCPLVLSTIHASKGLEYDRVILIDAADGLLPSVEEGPNGMALDGDEQALLEEERRLFYVAATRAREQLDFLCYEDRFGEPSGAVFSFIAQFLGETARKQPDYGPAAARPAGPTAEQAAAWMKDYIPGAEVTHKVFGRGTVRARDGRFAVIGFRETGEKKLDLSTCLRMGKIELTYL